MSKAATKAPPKGPQYVIDYVVSSSTSQHGPRIPTVSMTMRRRRRLTANKRITSKTLAKSTATSPSPIQ